MNLSYPISLQESDKRYNMCFKYELCLLLFIKLAKLRGLCLLLVYLERLLKPCFEFFARLFYETQSIPIKRLSTLVVVDSYLFFSQAKSFCHAHFARKCPVSNQELPDLV